LGARHIRRPPRHPALPLHGIQRHAGLETHIIVLAFFFHDLLILEDQNTSDGSFRYCLNFGGQLNKE
jgi:hypothetical protein